MARGQCSICGHPRRSQIERAWIEGTPRQEIAEQYQISYRQLCHHHDRGHVARDVMAARVMKKQAKSGSNILNSLEEYRGRINGALERLDEILAEKDNRDVGVIIAVTREQTSIIREATKLLELGGRLTGELDSTKFNLFIMPQWIEIRDVLFDTLEAYPEARLAILNAVTAKLAAKAAQALPPPANEAEPIEVEAISVETEN